MLKETWEMSQGRGISHKRLPLTMLSLWKRREVLLYQRMLINVEIMELEYYHLQNTISIKHPKTSESLITNNVFTKSM